MRTKEEINREITINKCNWFDFSNKASDCVLKIEELQKELEELNKRWKPTRGDKYYTSDDIYAKTENLCRWNGDLFDQFMYITRNCFKTKEEAEEELERILFINDVRDFIEEENDGVEINFNKDTYKYRLYYNYDHNGIDFTIDRLSRTTSFEKYFLHKDTYDKILAKFDNDKLVKWWI